MKHATRLVVAVLAPSALLVAGCTATPNTLDVTAVGLQASQARSGDTRAGADDDYTVPAGVAGDLIVSYQASPNAPAFGGCSLRLDGTRQLPIVNDGPGSFHVALPITPLQEGRRVNASLVCWYYGQSMAYSDDFVVRTAAAPVLTASPAVVDFGQVTLGTASTTQSVTFTNVGSAPLTPSGTPSIQGSTDFTATDGCGGRSLAPGDSCQVTVTFRPTTGNAQEATLVLASNADPNSQSVTLRGQGVGPVGTPGFSASPDPLAFGFVPIPTSEDRIVTVTNSGDAELRISATTLAGSDWFAIADNTCTLPGEAYRTLAPGGSCTTTIRYTPGNSDVVSATLTYTDNTAAGSHAVSITGGGPP